MSKPARKISREREKETEIERKRKRHETHAYIPTHTYAQKGIRT